MSPWQIEDSEMIECLDVMRGRRPRYQMWLEHCIPKSTKNVGSSPNWYALAAGVACHMKHLDGVRWLRDVLREPNDTGQQEALTDDSHFLMRMIGWYVARFGLRRNPGLPDATEILVLLDEHIRQAWAMKLLCATDPLDPAKTFLVSAGQRAADPKTGKSLLEYFWLRGHDYSHDQIRALGKPLQGVQMANQAERVYLHQEDVTHREFANRFFPDLRDDIQMVVRSLRKDGWPGVWGFVKRGTRGPFHFLRFEDDGYLNTLERDFGTDNPRTVAMSVGKGKLPAQFPSTDQPRKNTECWSRLDMAARRVIAYDSIAGTFASDFPAGSILFYGYTDKDGAQDRTLHVPPAVEPPPIPPGIPPITPPRPPSLWERFLEWLRGLRG